MDERREHAYILWRMIGPKERLLLVNDIFLIRIEKNSNGRIIIIVVSK
jgi:hypothetical protein